MTLLRLKKKGDIETTVNYNAKDSLNFNLKTQDIIMFKEAHVDYGDIELEADKIKVNYNTKILDASGITSDSHRQNCLENLSSHDKGDKSIKQEQITYNFDSKKAIIKGVVTPTRNAPCIQTGLRKMKKMKC